MDFTSRHCNILEDKVTLLPLNSELNSAKYSLSIMEESSLLLVNPHYKQMISVVTNIFRIVLIRYLRKLLPWYLSFYTDDLDSWIAKCPNTDDLALPRSNFLTPALEPWDVAAVTPKAKEAQNTNSSKLQERRAGSGLRSDSMVVEWQQDYPVFFYYCEKTILPFGSHKYWRL